ncbi:unnamed protein product [Arctia plantaginis]|uniref:Uncharacterized protein n=1 Tax=Arctia plantaginis TaxID=874455 RepID=A0A8S1BL34_ARCPL|nr:unnamed protein product [Arctia plantaginis]
MLKTDNERKRNLNGEHNDGTVEIAGQESSVVYDPPHLLNGLRNNLLTKDMVLKGKVASWKDILTVFKTDCQLGHTRMNKKLTEHHLYSDKMKKNKKPQRQVKSLVKQWLRLEKQWNSWINSLTASMDHEDALLSESYEDQ